MKQKSFAWIYIVMLSIGTILSLYIPKQETAAKEAIVIPNEAIRLRILANSDLAEDQALKRKIRDEVNKEITTWVESLDSIDDARKVIKGHLPDIEKIAKRMVLEENSKQTVRVEFGSVQFPTKLYGQFLYPAGEYEAVLITLGKGEGANWWCVLFPPLCFLDFSNGMAVSPGFEEKKESKNETSKTKKIENTQEPQKVAVKHESTDQQQDGKQPKSKDKKEVSKKPNPPVYTEEKDDDVEVKFFIVELFHKIF